MPIQDETIQKFQDLFACTKGFQAVPLTNTPDENGKIKYNPTYGMENSTKSSKPKMKKY